VGGAAAAAAHRAAVARIDAALARLGRVHDAAQARAAVAEAAKNGLHVAAHAHDRQGANAAVRAGVRSIEHGTYVDDETLALMRQLGVGLNAALLTVPLDLRHADGGGLAVPTWAARWPQPLALLAAILNSTGWSWNDKVTLLQRSLRWRATGFCCPADWSVERLCAGLPPRIVAELIEPLCLSALNTPMAQASGAVLLRVLRDALFGAGYGRWRGADLLLPRTDLGALLPEPALRWLDQAERRDQVQARFLQMHQELRCDTATRATDAIAQVIKA
jgi:hypothetical protein